MTKMALVVALVPEAWSGDRELPVNTVKAVYLNIEPGDLLHLLGDRVRGDLQVHAQMMAGTGVKRDAPGDRVAAQLDGSVA
jgi:hypothetical protein